MKICLLGDLKFEKKLISFKNDLVKFKNFVYLPIVDYEKISDSKILDINYYIYVRKCVVDSNLIFLVCDNNKDKTFFFNFGIVFGVNKKFEIIKVDKLNNVIVNYYQGVINDESS
jgi:hypothetical protein